MRLFHTLRVSHLLLLGLALMAMLPAHRAQAQPAQAQTGAPDLEILDDTEENAKGAKFTVNIGLTSDYRFRGFSDTNGGAAIQGGGDFTYDWFYAGVWATNVNFGQLPNDNQVLEQVGDFAIYSYVGAKKKFDRTELDGGFIYYAYPNSPGFADLDFYEFYGGVNYEFIPKDLVGGVTIYYSPDYQEGVGRNWIIESTLLKNLPKFGDDWQPSVSGLLAYSDGVPSKGGIDYWYWNVGASLLFDYFEFDLRYFDAFNIPKTIDCDNVCDGKIVGRITFEN
jgi:uncharacterized protein (TIGR02001 family)